MRQPGFDEPLEMLRACHVQIEAQLRTLERLGAQLATRAADAGARAAASDVLRYFDTSGAQHHRDEDEDLFPLLRRRAGAEGRAVVAAAIDELEREHSTMDRQWRRLRKQLSALAEGRAQPLDVEEIARFAWLYRRHMEREQLIVLPFAREILDAPERAALSERMAARGRG